MSPAPPTKQNTHRKAQQSVKRRVPTVDRWGSSANCVWLLLTMFSWRWDISDY